MKFRNIIIVLIFLISFLNIFLVQADEFPLEAGQEIKESWIINNVENFNPQDDAQRNVFREAYKDGRINLDDNPEVVEKYLLDYENGILQEDRSILNDFVSEKTGGTDVSLEKGANMALKKEGEKIFLASSDGQKHDLDLLKSLDGLDKISSKEDGTIVLGFGDNSINLQDTTINLGNFGDLRLSDGTPLKLNENFGNIVIKGSNQINCESDLCSFGLKEINVELNSKGQFHNLGNNRYSTVDGTVNFEDGVLAGSAEFSTDSLGRNINFDKTINLRQFSRDGQPLLQGSYVRINNEKFGNLRISTSDTSEGFNIDKTISRVVVCLECEDFRKNIESYDGYVDIKDVREGGIFNAEIKGEVGVGFGDDASHYGRDKNLLLSYDNSNPDNGIFKLKNCEKCREGLVGSQRLNGFDFRINNEVEEGKQRFNVKWANTGGDTPIRAEDGYSRNFYVVDETSETANMYLINANPSGPAFVLEKIDQKVLDDYVKYNDLVNRIELKVNDFCNKLSPEECQNFREFAGNMKEGKDGGIHSIVSGRCGGGILFQQQRRCMIIDNPEIRSLINQGKLTNEEIISLGQTNLEIKSFEITEGFKTLVKSLTPTGEEALFNLGTSGGVLAGVKVLSGSRGVVPVTRAVANLGLIAGAEATGIPILTRGGAGIPAKLDSPPEVFMRFQGIQEGSANTFRVRSFGLYDDATRKNVGTFSYEVSDDTLRVGNINILKEERGKGYSTSAFEKVLTENPGIKRIETRLEEVNKEVFMRKLINKINPKVSVGALPDVQFSKCCASEFSSLSAMEKNTLIESVLKETPAYKARLRNGFEIICDKRFDESTRYIAFSVCR